MNYFSILLFLVSFTLFGAVNNQNNPQSSSIKLGSLAADADVKQIQTIAVVADSSASLDAKYFILADESGTVAFWIDVDDDGATEPSHGADRSVEITTIATNDANTVVADKVAAAIDADASFSAPDPAASTVTATNSIAGTFTGQDNGDSGFTVAVTTPGAEGSVIKPGIYFPFRVRVLGVYLLNGANVAASNTDYLQLALKNGSNQVAELDTRAAHENGLTLNTAEPLNLSSTYSSVAAGSVLKIDYNETEATTVGLTNAQLVVLWYPY